MRVRERVWETGTLVHFYDAICPLQQIEFNCLIVLRLPVSS